MRSYRDFSNLESLRGHGVLKEVGDVHLGDLEGF